MAKALNPENTKISCYEMSQINTEFVLKIMLSLNTWLAAETHLADDDDDDNKWQYKRAHHQGQGYKSNHQIKDP